jgi:hypothetical protein
LNNIEEKLISIEQQNETIVSKLGEYQQTYANLLTRKDAIANEGKKHLEQQGTLIISSKNQQQSCDEIEGLIKRTVNVRSLGVGVTSLRKGTNNKIILKTNTMESMVKVKSELKRSEVLEAREANKKKPLVVFRGLVKGITERDLNDSLREQNQHLGIMEELKIKYRKKHRNELLANVICQVTTETWVKLTKAERVYIGFQRIYVADESPLVQCYGCLSYGHIFKYCTTKKERCAYCADEHDSRKCTLKSSNNYTCALCLDREKDDTGHSAFSTACPVRIIYERYAREATQYHC